MRGDVLFEFLALSVKLKICPSATIYAASEIPEYWIINLQDYQIEVFEQPKNGDYQVKTILKAGKTATSKTIGLSLKVNDVFEGLKEG